MDNLTPLLIKPGIVKDYTDYSMSDRWIDGGFVRFRGPFPEKIGGWSKSNSISGILGIARSLEIWRQIDFADNIAIGTHSHVQLVNRGTVYDITPLRKTTDPAGTDPLATNSNTTITVTDTSHGAEIDDYVTITGGVISAITQANPGVVTATAHGFSNGDVVFFEDVEGMSELNGNSYTLANITANTMELLGTDTSAFGAYSSSGFVNQIVDGVSVRGHFPITGVVDANNFEIQTAATATGSTSFGGTQVKIEYNISTGNENTIGAGGWGAGTYGRGGYGSSVQTAVNLTTWAMSVWGEDLVVNGVGGPIYYWDATTGAGVRSAVLSNAPATSRFIKADSDNRHLLVYGAHDGAVDDPMLVAWCDQNVITTWAPTIINSAGDYRLTMGGKIITAISSRSATLIFTDTSLYNQAYTGPPFTFRFNMLADNISIIGPNALTERDEIIYWMGNNQFYAYDGRVNVLPSSVRRYVFDNINRDAQEKCFLGVNRKYEEIWFFYPRGAATEPSDYVIYNYSDPQQQVWSIGTLERTVWHDSSLFVSTPIAIASDGTFYNHESGQDNDTTALTSYVESGAIEISNPETGKGGSLMLVDRLIPDATVTGNMKVTIYTKKYPQSAEEVVKGPYTIEPTTEKVSFRAKGRQTRIRLESDDLGVDWTMGLPRLRVKPSGKR